MDLEPNDLLLFARVVDEGSFTRAAQRVSLPKSTVSRRIAALETQLGERLLLRTTRKLSVTDLGHAVLEHARRVAEDVQAAAAVAHHRQIEPSGRLRVTMPADLANLLLAPLLAEFVARYPAITLEVDLSARFVDLISENFDLAIRPGDLQDDATLAARRIAVFGSALYAAPAYIKRRGQPSKARGAATTRSPAPARAYRRGDALGSLQRRSPVGRRSTGASHHEFARSSDAHGSSRCRHRNCRRSHCRALPQERRVDSRLAKVALRAGQSLGGLPRPSADAGANARLHRRSRCQIQRSRV